MSKHYAIGVDLGGTNLRVALVSAAGEVVEKFRAPSTAEPLEAMREGVNKFLDKKVKGIGLGIAGLIDRAEKRVIKSPNLPSLNGVSLKELDLGAPFVIENDANCAALGEKWMGAGRDFRSFILITLGTGIGGGFVYDDKLLEVAAEVGHMSIISGGEKCLCGNLGCLENYASARGIVDAAVRALEKNPSDSPLRRISNGNIYKLTAEDIYKSSYEGDALAREALKDAGKYLGVGIANLINMLSPEAVILTGGLTGAWDIFVEEAIREASKRAFKGLFDRVKIIPSSLGVEDAGILGAAALVLNERKNG